jgi:hypothetical protein
MGSSPPAGSPRWCPGLPPRAGGQKYGLIRSQSAVPPTYSAPLASQAASTVGPELCWPNPRLAASNPPTQFPPPQPLQGDRNAASGLVFGPQRPNLQQPMPVNSSQCHRPVHKVALALGSTPLAGHRQSMTAALPPPLVRLLSQPAVQLAFWFALKPLLGVLLHYRADLFTQLSHDMVVLLS